MPLLALLPLLPLRWTNEEEDSRRVSSWEKDDLDVSSFTLVLEIVEEVMFASFSLSLESVFLLNFRRSNMAYELYLLSVVVVRCEVDSDD